MVSPLANLAEEPKSLKNQTFEYRRALWTPQKLKKGGFLGIAKNQRINDRKNTNKSIIFSSIFNEKLTLFPNL